MDQESDMEAMREKMRAALDGSPGKSRKELAKLLDISPTQVSSLLKPGGRHLRAVEVPIVEGYLGITLLGSLAEPAHLAEHQVFSPNKENPQSESGQAPAEHGAGGDAASRERLPPARGPAAEGEAVAIDDLPPALARYLDKVAGRCAGQIWRLATSNVQAAGYLSGDYVVVDRYRMPRAKDVVLAELREGVEAPVPIFRAYVPPYLMFANSRAMLQSPLLVDDHRVTILGVIIASVRIRGDLLRTL
jgi:hypothetical protein